MPLLEKNAIKFDELKTFASYSKVYKANIEQLKQLLDSNELSSGDILIQMDNTVGLTRELLDRFPDNVDIRIVGGYTEEYMNGLKDPIGTRCRQKATYTKDEMIQILNEFSKIESSINPSWSQEQKALYLYESLKKGLKYYIPANDQINMRGREYDTLTGLITKDSLCAGYSHIYQELCTRQGIKCNQIGGTYTVEGKKPHAHAWDVITINDKSFLVDIIWDSQDMDKGIDHTTGFGLSEVGRYHPDNLSQEHQNLSSYNQQQVEQLAKQFDVPVVQKVDKRQEFVQKLPYNINGLDKVSDRVFDTIIQRYNLQSKNKEPLRMYECIFLTLKSYPEYKEQALRVANVFESMVEEKRIYTVKQEKPWGTYMDEFDKYETVKKTNPYHTLGNYAITLSDVYSYRIEQDIPNIPESLDFQIRGDSTINLKRYETLKQDLAQAGMQMPIQNEATVIKATELIAETERQNKAVYEEIKKQIEDKIGITGTVRFTSLLNSDNPLVRDKAQELEKELSKGLVNVYDIKSAEERLEAVSQMEATIVQTFTDEQTKKEEQAKAREVQKAKLKAAQQRFEERKAKEKHTFNPLYTDEELQALYPQQPDDQELLKEALAALEGEAPKVETSQLPEGYKILEDGTIERKPLPTLPQEPVEQEEKDPSVAELESNFRESMDLMEKQRAEIERRRQASQQISSQDYSQPTVWSTFDENGNEVFFKNIVKDGVVMDSVLISPDEYQMLGGTIQPVEEISSGKHR